MSVPIANLPAGSAGLAVVAAVAAVALLGALALQYLGGYQPCTLCIYERYPYLLVVIAGLLGLWWRRPRPALALAALALAVNLGLAAYHVGVEEGWFALPETCAAVGKATTVAELKAQLQAAPARCDQVPLSLAGLSLAAWNGVLAAALLAAALVALLRRPGSATEQHRRPSAA
jgi:disulfide bond formation protein DsbB